VPIPERIRAGGECGIQRRWRIDATLAAMLVELERWAEDRMERADLPPWFRWPGLKIVSGYRSPARQLEVNPGVPGSLHSRCPAMAADLRVGSIAGADAETIWSTLGAYWKLMGGRWGGDFHWEGSPRPNPKEWNHFDLGVGV